MPDVPEQPAADALVALPDDVLLRHVAGEAVLLHLGSGTYYGLEAIGTRMLDLALRHPDAAAVVAALEAEYDADAERLASDLDALLAQLVDAGLVVRRPVG